MVAFDILLTMVFYIASVLGVVGLSISNTALIVISLVLLGIICAVLIAASFVLDILAIKIGNIAAVVLPVVISIIIGAATHKNIAEFAFYGMLVSWLLSVIVLGVVDCYDMPEDILGTVFKKIIGSVFLFFAVSGIMNGINWMIITAIVGFGIAAIIMSIISVSNDYDTLKPLLTSIITSAILLAAVSIVLIFLADMVWWYSFALVLAAAYVAAYTTVTIVTGDVDGVTERICDIPNLF